MKKTLKRALCGIIVLVFMLVNANFAFAGDMIVFESDIIEPELYNAASKGAFDNLEKYVGDIDEFQKYLLDCMLVDDSNIENQSEQGYIDISEYNIPYNETMKNELFNLMWYESPELFRMGTGLGFSYTMSGIMVAVTPVYIYSDPAYFKEQYDVFVDTSEKLLSGIKDNNNLSDVEKALLLHDRLAAFCEYDYENLLNDCIPSTSYNAGGVFCLGTAVCMGYALAYDYLLEQVGIEAEYCASSALNHAWNIVYIDNKPYHVDVTWDDPAWDASGQVLHNNFLRSTDGIIATGHDATDYITTPVDTTYDEYFWQNSNTAFQILNDKIYYIDNENAKLNVIDDMADTTPEVLVDLDYKWTTDEGWYYQGLSKLASIRDRIFYSTPTEVYSYNLTTGVTETVLDESDIKATIGVDGYRIYGMTAFGCTLWGEYSKTPKYTSETKKEYIFSEAYHNPTENWKQVISPTESQKGKETNYCVDCGAEVGSRLIPSLGEHNWGEWYIDPNNKPTCTEKGVKLRDCQDAGCDVYEWDYADALGHTESDEWITDRVATCSEAGYMHKICTVCFETVKGQELPKGECSRFSTSGYTAVGCLTDGYTGDRTCLDCGTVYKGEVVKATDHSTKLVNVKDATCEKNGYTGDVQCMNCGEILVKGEETPAFGHKMSDWVVIKAPTITEKGLKQKKCETCGFGVTDVIPMIITLSTPSVSIKNSAKGINVSWNAIENAESYIVYRSVYDASTKKWSKWSALKTGVTATNYVDVTVKLGTTYKYTVRAVNGDVKSKYVGTNGLKYNITPTVKVANASNGIKVSWSTAANATGYRVYRSQYNTSTKKWSDWKNMGTAKANKTSWTDKNVKSGVQYKYTVRAMNNKVASSYNKSGVATMFLAQPTVKIANNAKGVKVSWSKVTGATGYTVYRSEYKNGAWTKWASRGTAKANKSSWVDTKVTSGVQYKYTVRVINGKYKSSYVSSGALLYLAQPTVKITNASTGVKVSWSASSGATGYTVYRSEYNTKTKKWSDWKNRGTAAANKTSWADKKVTSGVKYKYTVRAISDTSKSTYVSSNSLVYLAQPSVNVAKNDNGVKITWNKIAGATGYRIYRKANNETKWSTLATVKTTSYIDKSVSNDGTYTYTVRAYKDKVWSSYNTKGVTISLDYKKAVLDLVNAERTKSGLEPLEYYSEGQKAGDIRVSEIGQLFDHVRPDGTICFTVFEEQGIEYYAAGENIAIAFSTPQSVMDAWMNSEGHRANILTPGFTHLVVGYDETTNAWVQLFLCI